MIVQESTEGIIVWSLPSYALKTDVVIPRVGGVIAFLSSLYMLTIAWRRRNCLFHRLVFGMSVHLIVTTICFIYGAAAIPSDERNMLGNIGTVATCTIQGLFLYVCSMTACFYYISFSIYSYIGVLNNFEKAKIIWVEKWIHLLVHIYPIITGIYYLVVQNFNNTGSGFCYVTSIPSGCQFNTDIICERGPQDYKNGRLIHSIVNFIALLLPTAVMVTLFFTVKNRQKQVYIQSKTVAQQSFVYIVTIYWTILPTIILCFFPPENSMIPLKIFVNLNYFFFSVWSTLVYRYFSIEKKVKKRIITSTFSNPINNTNSNDKSNPNPSKNSMMQTDIEHNENSSGENINHIFNSQEITNGNTDNVPAQSSSSTPVPAPSSQQLSSQPSSQPRYSFNIFDGTNASGKFASFIYDGDSEDEQTDNDITDHWAAVQDYI